MASGAAAAAAAASAGCLTKKVFNPFNLHAPLRPHRFLSAANSRRCSSEQDARREKAAKSWNVLCALLLVSSGGLVRNDKQVPRSTTRPAASSTHDWIGPPNPLSNLRPIVYHVPENETELEKRLRHLRQETEDWNHDFWTKQNITFSKEKDAFIVSQLNAKGLTVRDERGRRRSLNSEEMAVFYKSFLDKNRIRHANYNKEWYRRNFTITLLMARVALNSMWKTITDRHSSKKNGTPPT